MTKLFLNAWILLALAGGQSNDGCTHDVVRAVISRWGAQATEEIRLCSPNWFITTGHNEIFIRSSRTAPRVLVARMENVGKKGVPLSWSRNLLLVHVPRGLKVQVLHRRTAGVSVRIVRDYTVAQQMRDMH